MIVKLIGGPYAGSFEGELGVHDSHDAMLIHDESDKFLFAYILEEQNIKKNIYTFRYAGIDAKLNEGDYKNNYGVKDVHN
jgi:hypothetical protein